MPESIYLSGWIYYPLKNSISHPVSISALKSVLSHLRTRSLQNYLTFLTWFLVVTSNPAAVTVPHKSKPFCSYLFDKFSSIVVNFL